MRNVTTVLLVFIIVHAQIFGQINKVKEDSLNNVFKNAPNDSVRMRAKILHLQLYLYNNTDTAILIAQGDCSPYKT